MPSRLILLALLILIQIGSAPSSRAQQTLFLKVDSIDGLSTDDQHPGWIDVYSLGFAVSRPIAIGPGPGGTGGRTTFSELTVTRQTDAISPLLLGEATSGEGQNVELELVRNTSDRRRYYRLRLRNALVSSFYQSSGGDVPSESVTFNFTRLDFTYTDFLAVGTREMTAWFDTATQTGGVETNAIVNTAPVVSVIQNTNTLEDTAVTIPFIASDAESLQLGYSATTSDPALLPLSNITFGGTGVDRTVRLLPGTNQSGTVTVSVIVSDSAHSTSRSFTLAIAPVNDAPVLAPIPAQTTVSNTPVTVPMNIADLETAADALTVSAFHGGAGAGPVFLFGGSGASRTLTITPPTGYIGILPVTVVVSDGALATSNSFTLNVVAPAGSNQPPILTLTDASQVVAIAGRWTPIPRLQVSDPDAGANAVTLRITANAALSVSNAPGLSISNNGGSSVLISGTISALNAMLSFSNGFSYRAPAGSAGTDLILFTVNDQGASGTGGALEAQKSLPVLIFRSGLHQWQHEHFTAAELADPAQEGTLWGANADPDRDGLENLAEYGLGTNPRSAAHAHPTAQRTVTPGASSFLFLEIAKRRDPDLLLSVMVANEVAGQGWSGDPAAVQVSTPIDLQNGFERIRFTDNTPIAEPARRFMRMRWSLIVAP